MTGPHIRPWTGADAPALRDAFLTTPDLVTQLGGTHLSAVAAAEAHIAGPLASNDAHRHARLATDPAPDVVPLGMVG